jgi:hypothetical protein
MEEGGRRLVRRAQLAVVLAGPLQGGCQPGVMGRYLLDERALEKPAAVEAA